MPANFNWDFGGGRPPTDEAVLETLNMIDDIFERDVHQRVLDAWHEAKEKGCGIRVLRDASGGMQSVYKIEVAEDVPANRAEIVTGYIKQ